MTGPSQPASSRRCLISGTAAAASGTLTVTRTISDPACASSMHCFAVPTTSAVSVLVIDWTTTGAPPPTWIGPTLTPTVAWRLRFSMAGINLPDADGAAPKRRGFSALRRWRLAGAGRGDSKESAEARKHEERHDFAGSAADSGWMGFGRNAGRDEGGHEDSGQTFPGDEAGGGEDSRVSFLPLARR